MLLPIQKLDEHGLRLAFESVNRCLEALIYRRADPAPWAVSNGAVLERPTIGGSARDISAARLPGTGNPAVTGSWPLPPLWVSGKLGAAIVYGGTVNSAQLINFQWVFTPVGVGDAIPLGTVATVQAPGPAGTAFLCSVEVPTLTDVDSSATVIAWKFRREANDAYHTVSAGEAFIFDLIPLWYPERQ